MRLSVTCDVLLDAHLKWCKNMEHVSVATCPQLRLCSSTLVEDLGRKLHVSHLQSQHLKMCLKVKKGFEIKRQDK